MEVGETGQIIGEMGVGDTGGGKKGVIQKYNLYQNLVIV